MLLCLQKWASFDLMKRKMNLYDDHRKKFSKLYFNTWDWHINNNYESRQLQNAIATEMKIIMDEDRIKEVIKKRKNIEKTKLFIRRTITLLINVFLLCIAWGLIILINYYD